MGQQMGRCGSRPLARWRGSDRLGQLLGKMKTGGGDGKMFLQRRVRVETTRPSSGTPQRARGAASYGGA